MKENIFKQKPLLKVLSFTVIAENKTENWVRAMKWLSNGVVVISSYRPSDLTEEEKKRVLTKKGFNGVTIMLKDLPKEDREKLKKNKEEKDEIDRGPYPSNSSRDIYLMRDSNSCCDISA